MSFSDVFSAAAIHVSFFEIPSNLRPHIVSLGACDGSFRPGQLAEMIEKQQIFIMTSLPGLIDNVLAAATVSPMAVSKDGYWADVSESMR